MKKRFRGEVDPRILEPGQEFYCFWLPIEVEDIHQFTFIGVDPDKSDGSAYILATTHANPKMAYSTGRHFFTNYWDAVAAILKHQKDHPE